MIGLKLRITQFHPRSQSPLKTWSTPLRPLLTSSFLQHCFPFPFLGKLLLFMQFFPHPLFLFVLRPLPAIIPPSYSLHHRGESLVNAMVNLKDTKQSFRSKKIQKEKVYRFIFRTLNNYVIERYLYHKLYLFNLSVKFNNVREKKN